jgi:hypothetical protein
MKRLAATAAVLAIAATAVVVATAGGQAPTGRTLTFTELAKGSKFAFVDNPPKSPRRRGAPTRVSVGDMLAFSSPLADQAGAPLGRLDAQCVFTAPGSVSRAEAICNGAYRLKDGTLSITAVLIGEPTTVTGSVNGGTGPYEGARGTFTSVNTAGGGSNDTVHLLP